MKESVLDRANFSQARLSEVNLRHDRRAAGELQRRAITSATFPTPACSRPLCRGEDRRRPHGAHRSERRQSGARRSDRRFICGARFFAARTFAKRTCSAPTCGTSMDGTHLDGAYLDQPSFLRSPRRRMRSRAINFSRGSAAARSSGIRRSGGSRWKNAIFPVQSSRTTPLAAHGWRRHAWQNACSTRARSSTSICAGPTCRKACS